jgi:hypothetical protein
MIGDKREESDITPMGHTGNSPMQIFLYLERIFVEIDIQPHQFQRA